MRLQTRFAITCCTLMALMLLILSAGVYLIAQQRIQDSVDEGLRSRAQAVKGSLGFVGESISREDVRASLPRLDRLAAQGTSFRIYDLDGELLYSSSGLSADPLDVIFEGKSLFTIRVNGQRTRVLQDMVVIGGQRVARLEVRDSLSSTDAALRDLLLVLAGGGALATAAVAMPAYWLGGRLADPVRRTSDLATLIDATADFSRRLPAVHAPREVRELTKTFNALVARIEAMMTAQRAFLAESSHEMRRPLTLLQTNIDVLGMGDVTEEVRLKVRDEMQAQAQSMSRLLSRLLLLSRGELGLIMKDEVDLYAVVQASIEKLCGFCKDHELVTELERFVFVLGDAERLGQLVDNLLENAHLYSPAGKAIWIRLAPVDGAVDLEVRDFGEGMSDEEVAAAFDRFSRGTAGRRARPDGHGLGLAIVKHVAEIHGGSARLQSQIGVGTTCTVSLPSIVSTSGSRNQGRGEEIFRST